VTTRVLIVDDHMLVAIGLQLALHARSWDAEVTSGPTGDAILQTARTFQPGCVLLDLHLGEAGSGLDLIAGFKELGAAVVLLTAETDRHVLASAIEAGADGWISKAAYVDEVVAALVDVTEGRSLMGRATREQLLEELRLWRADLHHAMTPFERLTLREQEVLAALIDGYTAEDIATTQIVALTTVRSQIRSVLQKLGVHSQLAAVACATRANWRPGPAASSSILRMPPAHR
jgi:two-component system, NarL family, nitrate/nitrite response regulator NarL